MITCFGRYPFLTIALSQLDCKQKKIQLKLMEIYVIT